LIKNQPITSDKFDKKEINIMKAQVNLTGRLTRDVTNVFSNADGSSERALFTIACNSYYKKGDEKKESVDFIPCIGWGGLVPVLKTWGKKGRQLHIIGTLETFQATPDEHGKYPPMKIQVRVESFEFLDKKPEGVEEPAKAPAAGTAKEIDMNKLAEMVAAKLLSAAEGGATVADTVNENAANHVAEETAQAQAEDGAGNLSSVV
jgi:single-strand DNA-binding protein